eukprot:CAMPEP_0119556100 /NCGR_PEP_ID=MMETSP1352-20130426/8141_1 /TAXON_ID=265584 /ORGANISM="Stauroneis constricta, Strain CCMP1120" /LENGTH=141 /DNA_ID=CAMNT_0007602999 /DNA_START=419 /DNA_END=844 /DNA_ORIENTATION=-
MSSASSTPTRNEHSIEDFRSSSSPSSRRYDHALSYLSVPAPTTPTTSPRPFDAHMHTRTPNSTSCSIRTPALLWESLNVISHALPSLSPKSSRNRTAVEVLQDRKRAAMAHRMSTNLHCKGDESIELGYRYSKAENIWCRW